MTWPPDSPNWDPIEQDWGAGGNVRLVPADKVAAAVEGPLRADLELPAADAGKGWTSPAEQARIRILQNANGDIGDAVELLQSAVAWFSVVDRGDYADLVRQVEGLADTIAYRLRNAAG